MSESESISSRLRKAKLCELFKRRDKAEELYSDLMRDEPTDFRAFFNCAILISEDSDRIIDAISYFKTVISLNPEITESYGSIAALLIKLHAPRDAVEYCRQGLDIKSTDRICLYNINVALRQIGKIDEALALSWQRLCSLPFPPMQREEMQKQHLKQNKPRTMNELTIVCVKWGKKYGADYVNNLFQGLCRHILSSQYRFKLVCFTDDSSGIDSAVPCYHLNEEISDWKGWWIKAQIFARHPMLKKWLLYIDLDTVICGPLMVKAE